MDHYDDFDALLRPNTPREAGEDETPDRESGRGWVIASLTSAALGIAAIATAVIVATAHTPSGELAATPTASAPKETASHSMPLPRPTATSSEGIIGLVDQRWVSALATKTGIPLRALQAYTGASLRVATEYPGCGLGWNTLAGIGHVESEHGTINGSHIAEHGAATPAIVGIALTGVETDAIPDTDDGVLDGDTVWDRAVGPMQFIPATWAEWAADGNGDGDADPQNIDDSALAAGRYLCHIGGDLTDHDRWIAAVAAYNNTIEYNNRVAEAADHYARLA
ncbi:lytic transglycosylase domain-containing protein [Okibacterium endophyticum]